MVMDTKKETHKSFFTGIEKMGPVINPGSTTHENGRLVIRGMLQQAQDDGSDPRVSGDLTIEANAYFDSSTLSGPMWGTFFLENKVGKWLCAWTGERTARGESSIEAWGLGALGFAGLKAHWNYGRQDPDPNAPFAIKGYITEAAGEL